MAKKSFSFRIDDDNMDFIEQARNHGDSAARLVNLAVRMLRTNMRTCANLYHVFSPSLLFEEIMKFKAGDDVIVSSDSKRHYNINGHIGKIDEVYRGNHGVVYNIALNDGRHVILQEKYIKSHSSTGIQNGKVSSDTATATV